MSDSILPVPFAPSASPKTIGQILDRVYRLMRSQFKLLAGIALLPSVVLLLIIAAVEAVFWIPMIRQFPKPIPPEQILRYMTPEIFIPAIVVLTLLSLAIVSIYFAAASYAANKADLGVKLTLSEAYGLAWRHSGRYLWLLVLLYLYTALPALLVEFAFLVGSGLFVRGGIAVSPATILLLPLGVLLMIAAVVYGILMGLRLSLAFPACVEEGLTARAAIQRSFQLTLGAKGRIFLVMLVIYAILYAVLLVAELVAMVLVVVVIFAGMAAQVHPAAPWSYIGLGLLGICVFTAILLYTAVTWAAMTAALAVLYHDQRLRKDGQLLSMPATPQPGEAV
jgi:hypothetical protein